MQQQSHYNNSQPESHLQAQFGSSFTGDKSRSSALGYTENLSYSRDVETQKDLINQQILKIQEILALNTTNNSVQEL